MTAEWFGEIPPSIALGLTDDEKEAILLYGGSNPKISWVIRMLLEKIHRLERLEKQNERKKVEPVRKAGD